MDIVSTYQNTRSSGSGSAGAAKAPAGQNASAAAQGAYTQNSTPSPENFARLQRALEQSDIPELSNGSARVELNFNQDTGRVVAKVTDRSSGEVLREIPSKELQQLFSQMRDYLGSIVDEEI